MLVSWTIDYDYDFEDDVIMDTIKTIIDKGQKPSDSMVIVKKAMFDYVAGLDDYYYLSIDDDTVDLAAEKFWNRHYEEILKLRYGF